MKMSEMKKAARKGQRMGKWTEESMKEAIDAVERGEDSIRKIAKRFRISASSIRDWMSGKTSSKKKGPPTVLSKEEEHAIVAWCLQTQKESEGMTFFMLSQKVADVCQGRETPFKNGVPGRRWLEWFKKRHPIVVLEPAQAMKAKSRSNSEQERLAVNQKTTLAKAREDLCIEEQEQAQNQEAMMMNPIYSLEPMYCMEPVYGV
jgi:transposase-like protein